MEEVTIVTRDINGERLFHYMTWDKVCTYIRVGLDKIEDDEILAVYSDGHCLYSALGNDRITWDDILAFFG